jgi:hypothetical protein
LSLTSFDFAKRQEEKIESIFKFVYEHLSKWRDDPARPNTDDEKLLNADFSKYLAAYAHNSEFYYSFFHEEHQGNKRTVDLSVYYRSIDCFRKVITVIECKRLSDNMEKKRKDEYVTGYKNITGGIQRFKLEKHGKDHEIVGIIGYVQTRKCSEWLNTINNCIDSLCGELDENDLCWSRKEYLKTIEYDEKNGKSYSKSLHPRITKANIIIYHLWVNM